MKELKNENLEFSLKILRQNEDDLKQIDFIALIQKYSKFFGVDGLT